MAEASSGSLEGNTIWSMTPDEAGAVLAERAADFHAPAAPLVPSNPNEARARLAQLTASAEWARRLMSGDIEARREFQSLSEMAAAGEAVDALSDTSPQPIIETTIGSEAVKRQDLISAAADLHSVWGPEGDGAIRELLDQNTVLPADFVADARVWKTQALNDPTFCEMLLRGDLWAVQRMTLFNAIIAVGSEA
jgi:hypothetical protein